MKSKSFRILIVAVCGLVIVVEAVLFALIFGEKSERSDDTKQKETTGFYKVKRVVRWTNPDATATYQFDDLGRITETVTEGRLRKTYPDFSSNYGFSNVRYYYDDEGKLAKITYTKNDEGWDQNNCNDMMLATDSGGGVYYDFGTVLETVNRYWGTAFIDREDGTVEQLYDQVRYDDNGRLVEIISPTRWKEKERRRCFSYEGKTVIRTDYNMDGELIRTCRFERDDWDRLVSAEMIKNGFVTESYKYSYDSVGNLVLIDHWGTQAGADYQKEYFYDRQGNLLKYLIKEQNPEHVWKENREYREFFVKEEYLTDAERKMLGLPYDPAGVRETRLIEPISWNFYEDELIVY